MTVAFNAEFVECSELLGGDIIQVSFDTMPPGHDEDERRSPSVLISCNFEFPGPATVDWHDGNDCDGGGRIISMTLKRDRILIRLDCAVDFDIAFRLSDGQFKRLGSYLSRMIEPGIYVAD